MRSSERLKGRRRACRRCRRQPARPSGEFVPLCDHRRRHDRDQPGDHHDADGQRERGRGPLEPERRSSAATGRSAGAIVNATIDGTTMTRTYQSSASTASSAAAQASSRHDQAAARTRLAGAGGTFTTPHASASTSSGRAGALPLSQSHQAARRQERPRRQASAAVRDTACTGIPTRHVRETDDTRRRSVSLRRSRVAGVKTDAAQPGRNPQTWGRTMSRPRCSRVDRRRPECRRVGCHATSSTCCGLAAAVEPLNLARSSRRLWMPSLSNTDLRWS